MLRLYCRMTSYRWYGRGYFGQCGVVARNPGRGVRATIDHRGPRSFLFRAITKRQSSSILRNHSYFAFKLNSNQSYIVIQTFEEDILSVCENIFRDTLSLTSALLWKGAILYNRTQWSILVVIIVLFLWVCLLMTSSVVIVYYVIVAKYVNNFTCIWKNGERNWLWLNSIVSLFLSPIFLLLYSSLSSVISRCQFLVCKTIF